MPSGWGRRGRPASRLTGGWRLDDKLPELLREVETRASEPQERRQETAQRAERRLCDWEAAMEDARARYAEHIRAEALTSQVERRRPVAR